MRPRPNPVFLLTLTLLTAATLHASPALKGIGPPPPTFSKQFVPDTIGPGSTAMLVFTIDNTGGAAPLFFLAFSDTLPTGMTLAAPGFVSNTCAGVNAVVTAPDGGSTIALSDGEVGAGQTCQVIVNVNADVPTVAPVDTTYTNTTGDLTYFGGNGGTATDDLMVDIDRPGFSKSFSPGMVEIGGRSTLTFTIDNQLNPNPALLLSFTDSLPAGMVVAGPSNATTDCDFLVVPAVTATPGASVISLSNGGVASGASCTVSVDVVGGAIGSLGNVSAELSAFVGSSSLLSGKAAAVLEVTGVDDLLELAKEFTDDPVTPGGSVTLEFTVTNKSRTDAATGITFSDDLGATLAGLTPTLPPTPNPPCGAGSGLAFGSGVLTLTGATLLAEASCTFSVELAVPANAMPGTYSNTAGPVAGNVGGSPESGNVAGDLLFVVSFPILSKEFTDDPVGAGDAVTLEFTITNPEQTSTMSGIAFIDELTDSSTATEPTNGFLPFPVSVGLPPMPDPPCGPGSSLALVSLGTDRQGLSLTGGSLAAGGTAGDSCTFSVTLDIPAGLAAGSYTNTTEEITGVLDNFAGPPTVSGPPASDELAVVAAPSLLKEFTDDPVDPGDPVTLRFTLTHDEFAPDDAVGVGFTDDLAMLVPSIAGLAATGLPLSDVCGTGNGTLSGSNMDTLLTFSGATLTPGQVCSFEVTLNVPGGPGPAPGSYTNTTSVVTAMVGGVLATENPASDDLEIASLTLSKEFIDDPVIAGGTATLRFTLDNASAVDATSITFFDDLDAALSGLVAVAPLPVAPCGATTFSGTSLLIFDGGSVMAGMSCSFDVTVMVPAMAADGNYINTTTVVTSSLPDAGPATDALIVDSTLLALDKAFTDDPVNPGDPVTLEFTLTNLSATETVTDIAFDDDLDAALNGLEATMATMNTCNGMATSTFPTGLFEYAGGSLMPGASCTIRLILDVPPAPLPGSIFTNTTTAVSGLVGALNVSGDPASDDLEVDLLVLSKAFDGPTIRGDTAVLSFTIENLDSVNPANGLAFSDDLDAVIPGLTATVLPSAPCGAGSSLSGSSFLALTGASVPAGGSCSFEVTVSVPGMVSTGDFLNTTSALFSSGLNVAPPATALLTIVAQEIFANGFENPTP